MGGREYLLRSATISGDHQGDGVYRFRFLKSGDNFKAWRVGGDPIRILKQQGTEVSGSYQ